MTIRSFSSGELARLQTTQESVLTDTCTIQRATFTQDSAGEPIPTWANNATLVKCRFRNAGEKYADPEQGLIILTTPMITLDNDADVTEQDRIMTIVSGGVSVSGTFTIETLIERYTIGRLVLKRATLKRLV